MIKIENLSYSFPQKELYKNISFTLENNVHCAFIGSNGSGKSTLVDMIIHPDKYMYEGKIETPDNFRIGYVSQFPQFDAAKNQTVFEYIAEMFHNLQKEIADICVQMETSTDLEPLLEQYQQALDAFEAIDGDNFESNINKKLNLADLEKCKDLLVESLSGGEYKLVQVIREMLTFPHLLIMDEPDVFLDFDNLNSLKNLINSHKGLLLVITHNRYLLNHCFNKILHLENKELQEFEGRYIDYNFTLLQGKIETLALAMADEEEIKRNEKIIERFRNAASNYAEPANGKSLGARVSLLERLQARRIKPPFIALTQPDISFHTNHPLTDEMVLKLTDYSAAFEDILLEHVDFEINSNEKIALIGSNGSGKTTLFRDIFKHTLDSIELGENVELAFLSQEQEEMLNFSNTIQEEFFELGFSTVDEILTHILKYGFNEESLSQKIGALSGGEKNMLQLAKISVGNANFLLLDEPTSHLDTYSQIALESAIQNYNGAVFMISHDFYSVVNCMDYAYIIDDKTIRKISMRKFRKMIYAKHFSVNYLEVEQKKKELETKIELAMKASDFELAKTISDELEKLLPLL